MNNYISIKQVLDDLLDNPLLQDITLERVINYTVEFIRKIGMPKVYKEVSCTIAIEDYRALLPCDFVRIIQIRDSETHRVYISSTDSFHNFNEGSTVPTYKIQGQVIITSVKDGTIDIVYQAIPVDKDGYPMIVDNASFIEALELYITKKRYKILFDIGKLRGDVYNSTCQDYAWAVGQAQTSLIMPTIDELQSITNMWNTLVMRTDEHSRGFKSLNTKENFKHG